MKNKVANITGAGNGQGAFEADLFAKEGAAVVVTDIDVGQAVKVAQRTKQNMELQ
ncbi:hypothetical protein [Niallia sp. Krafla_26]|uniref:hypothetical protein n=1 Tax=Niallia sp. Krafla_26 TaxID=3064703 RepID=UPI003D171F0D